MEVLCTDLHQNRLCWVKWPAGVSLGRSRAGLVAADEFGHGEALTSVIGPPPINSE